MPALFDMKLRAMRRDRAARAGAELFLYERAFSDCLDRLSLMQQRYDRALLIGCPHPDWPERLHEFATHVDVIEPGPLFAIAAGAIPTIEEAITHAAQSYDAALAVGTLDTVNDLPRALVAIRASLGAGGVFLGALSGGDTLSRLRSAMHAADLVTGAASPHVHPRIEAAALAPLLTRCGFSNPVVDVDRVEVSYPSLQQLVDDLRKMAATNMLTERRRRPLSRRAAAAAATSFAAAAQEGRTVETFEILHFACWAPSA